MPGFIPLESSDGYQLLDSDSEELLIQTDQMSIGFCVSSSEPDRLDKTGYLSEFEWINGTLREEASILNPILLIEYSSFQTWNYAYIPNFNRYYFIREIVSVRTGLWRIVMREDVMMSFKDAIREQYAMISRNEIEFDRQVNDAMYPVEYRKSVEETTPENLDPANCLVFTPGVNLSNKFHIALSVINYYQSNGGSVYDLDPGYLPAIDTSNFVGPSKIMTYIMDNAKFGRVLDAIINDDSKSSYILSAIAYPYEIPAIGSPYDVYLGKNPIKWSVDGVDYYLRANRHPSPLYAGAKLIEFQVEQIYDYYKLEPYCLYELYIPYAGWIKLPIETCRGDVVMVYYAIDHIQGSATAYLYDKTKHRLLWSGPAQIGTRLSLSTTNALENKKTEEANNLNLIMGLISSSASIGIGVATENPVAVVGGVLSAGKSIASFTNTKNLIIDRAQSSSASVNTGLNVPNQVRLRVTKMITTEYGESFCHQYGRPLNAIRQIGTLSGYTVIDQVHVSIEGAYTAELDEIESILKQGFHI